MLTKLEITQKKAKSEQLDLVDTISTDDKVRQKRMFVIVAIIATIGLSFVFWLYREIKSLSFSVPSIPEISLSKIATTTAPNLDTQIQEILGKDVSEWKVITSVDSQISADLSRVKASKNSLIKSSLPEGLDIKENYQLKDGSQFFVALITTPQKRIYMSFSYSNLDTDKFSIGINKLAPAIYWSSIQTTTN